MWICPKCGREFKKVNQGHYCGTAPKTVSEYINLQTLDTQLYLKKIASIIKKNIPGVDECISWSMPTYKKGGKSVSFYANKNHVSLYIGEEAIDNFSIELSGFQTKKSAVYLPYNKTLPVELIENIIKWCLL